MSSGLAEGTFRLSRSVQNPRPDRRVSRGNLYQWYCWEEFQEGEAFIVCSRQGSLQIYPRGASTVRAIDETYGLLFALLADALEPVTESVSDYMIRRYGGRSTAGRVALQVLETSLFPDANLITVLDRLDAKDAEENG